MYQVYFFTALAAGLFSAVYSSDKLIADGKTDSSVSNKVVDLEELESLCHHFYKDDFVISAEVLENGCKLECILLHSSGAHGLNFFDSSVTKAHNLNDGFDCGVRQICNNGTCIASNEPETGKLYISIYNASLPDSDRASEGAKSDAFVKLYVDDKFLTKSKVIEDDNQPIWRQTFVSPLITDDTMISLLVFDKDDNKEELILTVQTNAKQVIERQKNASIICSPEEAEHYLCYAMAWLPQLLTTVVVA